MEFTIGNSLICVAIGLVTGLVAGLCGVGGGIIMVPAFTYFLKLDQKTAVATSLAAVILTSLTASSKNYRNDLVDWKITIITGVAAAAVAWFSADWLKSMRNNDLTRIFAVVLILVGIQMLWKTRGAA